MSEKVGFDWTNGQVKNALDAMTEVCAPENRFPIVTSVRVYRNRRRLVEAWEPAEQVRNALIREHGVETDGGFSVPANSEGYDAFIQGFTELVEMNGATVELEILSLAEIEKGYVKDPETGQKSSLGVSPAVIGLLMELELVTEDGRAAKDAEEVVDDNEALERDEETEDVPEE